MVSFNKIYPLLLTTLLSFSTVFSSFAQGKVPQKNTMSSSADTVKAAASRGDLPINNEAIVNAGRTLFNNNCTVCHSAGTDYIVGPGLAGINERRSHNWLLRWIKNSQALIQAGDPEAVAVYKEYNKQAMPSFNFTDEEITAILTYIASVETEASSSAPPLAGSPGEDHIPIDGADEEASIGHFQSGSVAYNVPDSMVVGKTKVVSLILSKNISQSDLRKYLEESIAKDPNANPADIVTNRITISKVMRAKLYAHDEKFDIDRASENEQHVILNDSDTTKTTWEWYVKPLEAGNHYLKIKISAMINDGGREVPQEIEVYSGTIPVTAVKQAPEQIILSKLKAVLDFGKDYWELIVGIITAVSGAITWLASLRKKRQDQENLEKKEDSAKQVAP